MPNYEHVFICRQDLTSVQAETLAEEFKSKIVKILEEKKTIPNVNWKSIFDLFDSDKDDILKVETNLEKLPKYVKNNIKKSNFSQL